MPSPGCRGSLGWEARTPFFGDRLSQKPEGQFPQDHISIPQPVLYAIFMVPIYEANKYLLSASPVPGTVFSALLFPSGHSRTGPNSFLG